MIWIVIVVAVVALMALAGTLASENPALSVIAVILAVSILGSGLYVAPIYAVWEQGLAGEAALAKAAQTKQIMIQTSLAEKESAQNKADAISIMGAAAKAFPEYRQQEFMTALGEALREGNVNQVMYIPTEAMIPITEAGKR